MAKVGTKQKPDVPKLVYELHQIINKYYPGDEAHGLVDTIEKDSGGSLYDAGLCDEIIIAIKNRTEKSNK